MKGQGRHGRPTDAKSATSAEFMKMCDQVRTLGIRTNADTPGRCAAGP